MEINIQQIFETSRPDSPDILVSRRNFDSSFWKSVFLEAREKKAADIHIEPIKDGLRVRLGINDELVICKNHKCDSEEVRSLINLMKRIARFDISEIEISQSRGFSLNMTDSRYRGELTPSYYGQSIVLRVIRNDDLPVLKNCGLDLESENDFRKALSYKSGIVLVTGPTGSGKSTTLQGALMEFDREKKKVISFENPVERNLPYVIQHDITSKFSWSQGISSAMRKAPHIIFIGEIKDADSAKKAVEAAMTGHLVLSTLHTNNVPATVYRLVNFGVDQAQLSETLKFVSAQRLTKLLCPSCKKKTDKGFTRGDGCETCGKGSTPGIVGRKPILEYSIDPDRAMIVDFNYRKFKETQVKTTLFNEASKLVEKGLIDYKEAEAWKE